jgi:ADP-L-glycero-D-manno-heptose 6-epimerase
VYGVTGGFAEFSGAERPLNVYGWSKWIFDRWLLLRSRELSAPVVGLRYFNVYGSNETHKGRMASVVHHFHRQILEGGTVRLFAASHGHADGEHRRDFVHVDDVVGVNVWAMQKPGIFGVFNVGTGNSRSFNDIAREVIAWLGRGQIAYVPMPDDLRPAYQAFTEADLTRLRAAGYRAAFAGIEAGVKATLDGLAMARGPDTLR